VIGRGLRKLLPFLLLTGLCAVLSSRGQTPAPARPQTGRVYFVATDGNDARDGLAPAAVKGSRRGPFRTLGRAAQAVRAGDTVQVRGGVYVGYAGSWGFERGGTAAAPITIMAYPGEAVVIDGAGRTLPDGPFTPLMQVYGDWFRVSDLEFRDGSYAGLNIAGDHCLVENVTSHHNRGSGIFASGGYNVIDRCRAYANSLMNERGTMSIGWGFGISLCAGARSSVVRRSTAWHNWGEGLSIASGYDCVIEDCVSYDNFSTNIYISQSVRGACRRNLSYYTPGNPLQAFVSSQNCIILGDEGRPPNSAGNTVVNNLCLGGDRALLGGGAVLGGALIAHNTFVNAFHRLERAESACVYFTAGSSKGGRFVNNIVLQDGRVPVAHLEARGVAFGPNVWSRKPVRGCRSSGDIVKDPMLSKAGPAGPGRLRPDWFELRPDSPAVDRAIPLAAVSDDLRGRPRRGSPDLGALESATRAPVR
jgi:hypothetical protein